MLHDAQQQGSIVNRQCDGHLMGIEALPFFIARDHFTTQQRAR